MKDPNGYDVYQRLMYERFARGQLVYSEYDADVLLFAEKAREVCSDFGVDADAILNFRAKRGVVRANKGFPLDVKPFSEGSNTSRWRATNREWQKLLDEGIGRGCS